MGKDKIDNAIEAMNESIGNRNIKDRIQEGIDINQGKIIGKEISYSNKGIKEKMLKPEEVLAMPEKIVNIDPLIGNNTDRDNKGKFLPGNQCGKVPRDKVYSTKELTQAIREVEEEDNVNVLKHYVRQSLIDNRVMIDLIGKNAPKITITELKNAPGNWHVSITQFIEEKREKKAIEVKELNDKPL